MNNIFQPINVFLASPHVMERSVLSKKVAKRIVLRAQEKIDKITSSSKLHQVSSNPTEATSFLIPAPFFKHEVTVGAIIGSGGFCDITEVNYFRVSQQHPEQLTDQQERARENISQRKDQLDASSVCKQYVLKHVQEKIVQHPKEFLDAAIDLAREAHMLSAFQHPNIIKLRGCSILGVSSYETGRHDANFLIFDRLTENLEDRIDDWKKSQSGLKSVLLPGSKRKSQALLAERLKICADIAGALAYLHKKNIMHRDLKPSNLGFDREGNIQLFDFGIAAELSEENDNNIGTYKLTGGTGSLRYMAPEVARNDEYNLKVDVYSFTMLGYAILALEKPFARFDSDMLKKEVFFVQDGGSRPRLYRSSWSNEICQFFERGWSDIASERPTMQNMHTILMEECNRMHAKVSRTMGRRNSIAGDTHNNLKPEQPRLVRQQSIDGKIVRKRRTLQRRMTNFL